MLPVSNAQEAILEGLQREQRGAETLSELHAKPISIPLKAYVTELEGTCS